MAVNMESSDEASSGTNLISVIPPSESPWNFWMNIEIFLQSNLIPTLVISTCVWCGHWGALLIHQSHVWQHSVSIHCLQPIWTYHEVETLLVELGEVPGHSVQSNMLVLQTEPLPTLNFNFSSWIPFSHLSLYAHTGNPCLRDVERPHPHWLPDQGLLSSSRIVNLFEEPVDKGGDSRLGVPHSLLRRAQVANYHHPFDFLQGATCVWEIK